MSGDASGSPLVTDAAGALALRTATIQPHTVLDTLTGEELALALTAVVQVRIDGLPLATPSPVQVLAVVRGAKSSSTRLAVPSDLDGLIRAGAAPIVSVYFVDTGTVVMNAISAVGYFVDGAVSYRSAAGQITRYPLSADNLFGCLARTHDPDGCERRGLRRYGIDSPVRLSVFRRLRSADTLAASLWFVVFDRSRRSFPDRLCRPSERPRANCASYTRFKGLSKFSPSS